jgi:hypothetical protein
MLHLERGFQNFASLCRRSHAIDMSREERDAELMLEIGDAATHSIYRLTELLCG